METPYGSNVKVEATFGVAQKLQDNIEQSVITEPNLISNFPPEAKAVLDLIENHSQTQRFRKFFSYTKRKNKRGDGSIINEKYDYIQVNSL